MKIFTIIATLFLFAGCAHFSGNSSAVDIEGTWKGEMKNGMGGQPLYFTFNFKKEGDSVKGTVNGMPGQWIPLKNIEINGKKITFAVESGMEPMKMKINYKGKIKGDMIKMKFKTEMPGGSGGSGRRVTDMSAGGVTGGSGGAFSGGGFSGSLGMYGPPRLNEFTVERVSRVPENPIN